MSSDPDIIIQQLSDILRMDERPDRIDSLRHEYLMYRFCTDYVFNLSRTDGLSKIRGFLRKIIELIRAFARSRGVTDDRTMQILCTMYLTSNTLSTGSVLNKWAVIEQIIYVNGNIRELFYLLDEFLHQGCEVMNWFLYQTDCVDNLTIQGLNHSYIEEKIRQNANNMGIQTDALSVGQIQSEILSHLSKSGLAPQTLCQLWNNKNNSNPINRIQSVVEHSRLVPFINHSDVFCIRTLDDRLFAMPKICDDLIRSKKTASDFPTFTSQTIKYPILSDREVDWCKSKNSNYEYDGIIPWRSGCCSYQPLPLTESVIGRVSELYVCANRVTSLSGHTIINLDLFKILDEAFDQSVRSYVIMIMATMIPYGHHSAHEILSPASYFGVDYDLTADTENQIRSLDPLFDPKTLATYQREFDQRFSTKSS